MVVLLEPHERPRISRFEAVFVFGARMGRARDRDCVCFGYSARVSGVVELPHPSCDRCARRMHRCMASRTLMRCTRRHAEHTKHACARCGEVARGCRGPTHASRHWWKDMAPNRTAVRWQRSQRGTRAWGHLGLLRTHELPLGAPPQLRRPAWLSSSSAAVPDGWCSAARNLGREAKTNGPRPQREGLVPGLGPPSPQTRRAAKPVPGVAAHGPSIDDANLQVVS